MRVLHAAQSSEYGLGRYLADLVAAQVEAGWDVTIAGNPDSELRPLAHGATWLAWQASRDPGPSTLAEARALARLVKQANPDVVHLHSSKAGLAGRLALRRTRPTVFQPHAWSFYAVGGPKQAAARLWERVGARWADVIVCGSQGEHAQGVAAGIKARRWEVVPNAVDTHRFSPGDRWAARTKLGLPHDAPIAVCAGRLAIAQKGQDVLLAAWPAVEAAVPDARLVLVGDGPDRADLERRASASASVEFAGASDEMPAWFRAADVVVAPSRYETLSLSVLEACACGRSVVATDAVGMREAVGDTGAVVPMEDADALAAAVIERLKNPKRAALEGEAARSRVEGSFGRDRWAERMLALTEAAARREPSP